MDLQEDVHRPTSLDASRRQIRIDPDNNYYVMAVGADGGSDIDEGDPDRNQRLELPPPTSPLRRRGFLRRIFGCVSNNSAGGGEGSEVRRRRKKKKVKDPRLRHILDKIVIKKYEKVKSPAEVVDPAITIEKKSLSPKNEEDECATVQEEEEVKGEEEEESNENADEDKENATKDDDGTTKTSTTASNHEPNKKKHPLPDKIKCQAKRTTSCLPQAPKVSKCIPVAQECAICWEQFKPGQKICTSPNVKCVHSFHSSCMITWLMNHNECPMCRADYLYSTPSSKSSTSGSRTRIERRRSARGRAVAGTE